jgi:hypothetical protein
MPSQTAFTVSLGNLLDTNEVRRRRARVAPRDLPRTVARNIKTSI